MNWAGLKSPGRRLSLRVSLFLGFAALTLISGALGTFAIHAIRNAADLVVETYDKSLMSINYAHAAAADFALLKSALLQRRIVGEDARARLDLRVNQLRQDLDEDLSIAQERAQSPRAVAAVAAVRQAVAGWDASWAEHQLDGDWSSLARFDDAATREIDLLVNYTAGDGFSFRQTALSQIETDWQLFVELTAVAVLVSLLLSQLLGRRILSPIALASETAGRIAHGELDTIIPRGGADELGRLLRSMAVMRDSIAGMMAREVAQRRSAQTRLSDAIENSREGVILVNAEGEVVVTNSQALEFFADLAHRLGPGAQFSEFVADLADRALAAGHENPGLPLPPFTDQVAPQSTQVELRDGRAIRIGWSLTGERGLVAFCSDMTAWRQREAQLTQSNLWLDAAMSNMSQGLCLFDHDLRLTLANRRFCEIFGLAREQLDIGMTMPDLLALKLDGNMPPGTEWRHIWAERQPMLRTRRPFTVHLDLAQGRVVEVLHQPLDDGGWIATYEDATERHRSREKILFMARHDALTGLPNRLLFGERLEAALAGAGPGRRFALLCIDLDHFKSINDTLGHPVGDRLLRGVAERFSTCARGEDTTSRLGGDEFAALLTGLRHPHDAVAYAERLIEVIRAPFLIDGHQLAVSASVGIAVAPDHGSDRDTLMRNADIALYRAKAGGRSAYRLFEPAMEAEVQARRRIELELEQAIALDQLELHYQPIHDSATLRLTGFEALLRWRHPQRGLLGAGEFVPVAEDTETIIAIGQWVLREACRTARDWPPDIRLSINVSAVQLRSGSFSTLLVSVLDSELMAPSRLELEVTETVLLQRDPVTLGALQRLQAMGVSIALDDFGTGYSSLTYLQNFRFDRIKIDQSFVRGLPDDQGAAAIVRAIIGLAASLGIPTTAEGVEGRVQLDTLREQGCREVQGFLLGRPIPASGVPAVLAQAASDGRVVKLRPAQRV